MIVNLINACLLCFRVNILANQGVHLARAQAAACLLAPPVQFMSYLVFTRIVTAAFIT